MVSQALSAVVATSWRTSPSPEVLDEIHRPEVNLVCWNRPLPPGVDEQLAAWARRLPADFDEVVPAASLDLAAATDGLDEPLHGWLTSDLAALLARFASLAQASRLRVSFGAVRSDQCRKFHMDYVRYRLISTYAGPGTEWVPDDAVSREALGRPASSPWKANQEIVPNASVVRHAVAGDVIVMKGARHEHRRGAVHRSPPIAASGKVRVVLVASTVDAS
ncbi:hypothetical protein BE08_05815 [Sorangium cellulosum]|uniref:DUF1826 domain-containing protein n=1 Tax=Sorangium cellulosum TaxID=56 RepID=A0A150PAN0_SORCE|nr:hypothetical protein BE08_05815 [Sorangium cellulosum]